MTETEEDLWYPLHSLVREVLAASDAPDPGTVADLVMARIPEQDSRAALSMTIREYVRSVMNSQFAGARRGPGAQPPAQSHAQYQESAQVSLVSEPAGAVATVTDERGNKTVRSRKTQALRAYASELATQRLHVAPGSRPEDYKFFGVCAIPDLRFAAQDRRDIAAATHATGNWFESFIPKMIEHKAELVQDLPHHVLAELFEAKP